MEGRRLGLTAQLKQYVSTLLQRICEACALAPELFFRQANRFLVLSVGFRILCSAT